jgi:Tfp pilus assembly PilM family ATPase
MRKWFGKKIKSYLGVDLSDSLSHMVAMEFQGSIPTLLDALSVETNEEKSIEVLMQTHRIGARKYDAVAVSVPQNHVDVRYLTLPLLPVVDLRNMIGFEMIKKLDYRLEEASIDYTLSGSVTGHETNLIHVIGFACRQSITQAIINRFSPVGLTVDVIDVIPMALMNFYAYTEPAFHEQTIVGIHIGSTNANIVVAKKGHLLFSRYLPVVLQMAPKELPRFAKDLSAEVFRTLEYCEIHFEPLTCSHILLTGEGEQLPQLAEFLHEEIGLICNTADLFSIPSIRSQTGVGEKKIGSELAVAAGLALRLGSEPS